MAKTVKKEEKQSFEELVAELNKKFAGKEKEDYFDVSTGSMGLDWALGGGVRSGRITEIRAWEGAGKTTVCLHIIAEAQRKGLKVAYVDAEHALDEKYARSIGVNWEALLPTLFQPSCGEDAFAYGEELIKSGELDVIIFDSTSGMIPKSQVEGEVGSSSIGKHAMLFSKEMPKINAFVAQNNVAAIFVSQFREKIGVMFGSPETTQAGNALRFFASNIIELRRSLEKDGDAVIGLNTKFKVLKCKTAPPYRTGSFPIVFGLGIDKVEEIIDVASELEIIYKRGSSVTVWTNKETKEGDKYELDEFKRLIIENEEFYEDLKTKCLNKLNESKN